MYISFKKNKYENFKILFLLKLLKKWEFFFYNYDNVYVYVNICIFNIVINGKNSKF